MASIAETIVGDRKLVLGNEEFVRMMSIGAFWSKIRIAFRVSINGSTTFTSGALQVGVCQGTSNTFSSASCTDYIGAAIGNVYPATYTWSAGPPARYGLPQGVSWIKRTGNTNVVTNSAPFIAGNVWAAPASTRGIYGVDIIKGSPSYIVHLYTMAVASADINSSNFLSWMEDENATNFTVNNLAGNSPASDSIVSYSGAGLFDTVSIVWNKSTPTIEISDVSIVRYY